MVVLCVRSWWCRGLGRQAEGEPFGRRPGRAADLVHQPAEMGFLDRIEPPAAVLGRIAPGIDGVADEGPVRLAALIGHLRHGDDLIDDAGQLVAGLGAFDLRHEHAAVEVVQLLVEDADKPDVLGAGVLQVGQPSDHLAAVQPIGTAAVGAAGAIREGFRLALAPLQAQAPRHCDAVDEHGVVAVQRCRLAEAVAHRVEMGLAVGLIVTQRRVGAADEHRDITAFLPGPRPDAVAAPALDSQITGLQVEKQRRGRGHGQQQGGLADPRFAKDRPFDAAPLSETLVGGNDGEAHRTPSPLPICSAKVGLPVLTVRATSKAERMEPGHAPYLRSDTL